MDKTPYGDITIDVSATPYETGFKFNTLPFGGMTIDAGNAVRLSSASDIKLNATADIRLAPASARYVFVQTTGDKEGTPTAAHRGALFLAQGGAGEDVLWVCLKGSGGGYDWKRIAGGDDP